MEYQNLLAEILTRTPRVGKFIFRLRNAVKGSPRFSSSAEYWAENYRQGGNSGPGSYGRLAAFKAEVLNGFVAENEIKSVIEFGSGDGAQLSLAKYPKYTGVDLSEIALDSARRRCADVPGIRFLHTSEVTPDERAELALSLDVVYHLVEDEQFEVYMRRLFDAATRFVIIYSSNVEREWPSQHIRHRRFTPWVEQNEPDFELIQTIRNLYPYWVRDPDNTSCADFFIFAKIR
ncbi:hypothetical protein GGC64_001975 [Mycobacterium sp. OAS707]|uniref:class I SAM-dependent methyltransferase n=1 Tax=Mycobacterium sp. OAS707 TaxID=2663822 RepID=UPI0019E74647|nr:class I SAM-dependent methyltransferase [Mycobacterium sp. OAS707]MBE1547967.1 hypothetical protein [Mycobacterium sp. OAS707]